MVLKHCSKIRMQLPSILCVALSRVTPLIFCVTDFVSAIKNETCQLTCGKILVRLINRIVDLDLVPFNEMVENRCCRSKKHVNYHIFLSSQNDQTGSVVVV